ncbi:MAG: hypothetical protein RMJ04_13385 [Geminicoccaceae bacterium]|nr:hypothetical protein [Geminicoccaceae bacterium]MDW8125757.1 hypothetical protein [Geminicoccaceae bacterium]
MIRAKGWSSLCLASLVLAGCQLDSRQQVLAVGASQVQLRQFQSRQFETGDRERVLRAVIATLQDLGFVVDKADPVLGTISGTKLDGYALRMTVTTIPRGTDRVVVRANAQYNLEAVEEPLPYQQFFAALEKSLFLAAQNVD